MIGTHLLDHLRSAENFIICQTREDTSNREGQKGVEWITHDLVNDPWDCLDEYELDAVFHLAAQTSAYAATESPKADLEINVTATIRLLDYFRHRPTSPFFVLASTATIAGVDAELPITEDTKVSPSTFYDLSKYTAERYLLHYIQHSFVNGCCLRLANVYGISSEQQREDRGILDKVYLLASEGKTINIYGHGNYLRDYVHISDVVSAFIAAEKHRQKTNGQIFYIGTGRGVYLKDAFLMVAALAARRSVDETELNNVPWPSGALEIELRNAEIDSSLFTDLTGWAPRFSLEEGLEAAYKRTPDGITQ